MIILIFLISFYTGVIFSLFIGFKKITPFKNNTDISVSIIVAARNEERMINDCVEALIAQNYPKSLLEIIIIDDHSSDRTFEILKNYQKQYPQIKIIQNKNTNLGDSSSNWQLSKQLPGSKKYALTKGIEKAKGKLLLFTDADCAPPATWVKEMVAAFDDDVGVVAGFSPLIDKKESLLGKLIELDSLVAATIAAGGIGINKPITCTGRNFAYRKKVFEQVNGFNDIFHSISGDDDLFLHLIKKRTNWKIRYNISHPSIVPSYQTKTIRRFLLQKKRHISAGKYYPRNLQISYSIMHLTNFGIYLFLLGSIILNIFREEAITLFLIKITADFLFIGSGIQKFNKKNLFKYFPLWEIFYLCYHMIIAPSAMIGKIWWDK